MLSLCQNEAIIHKCSSYKRKIKFIEVKICSKDIPRFLDVTNEHFKYYIISHNSCTEIMDDIWITNRKKDPFSNTVFTFTVHLRDRLFSMSSFALGHSEDIMRARRLPADPSLPHIKHLVRIKL